MGNFTWCKFYAFHRHAGKYEHKIKVWTSELPKIKSWSWVNDIVSTTQSSLLAWAMRLWEVLVLLFWRRVCQTHNGEQTTICLTAWQPYDCSSSKAIGDEVEESSEDAMLLKFFWHMKSWEPWHIEAESITLSRLNMIVNCKTSTKANPAFSRYLQPLNFPIIWYTWKQKSKKTGECPGVLIM